MTRKDIITGDPLPWLLEPDLSGVRYLALRDLMDLSEDDPEVVAAQEAAHQQGPISSILAEMHEEGYWVKPGAGYSPSYRGSFWTIITLSQLGASALLDERISRACTYLLDHTLTADGRFSRTSSTAPSGNLDCLQGQMCEALMLLGYDDPRLEKAFEWMARSITGEGVAPAEDRQATVRFYASGNCGPVFACGYNDRLPCAWGAIKLMLAFSKWPVAQRTPLMERAINQGVEFLLSTDPATAEYPAGNSGKPSPNWWKFGFPVFYITDLLDNVGALVGLGYGSDPRLARALDIILDKQGAGGRWALEYKYTDKTWVDFGERKQPNKWVTLRALCVLKGISL